MNVFCPPAEVKCPVLRVASNIIQQACPTPELWTLFDACMSESPSRKLTQRRRAVLRQALRARNAHPQYSLEDVWAVIEYGNRDCGTFVVFEPQLWDLFKLLLVDGLFARLVRLGEETDGAR
jgi:hypothetical protein